MKTAILLLVLLNYTPIRPEKAACLPQQVCQTCTRVDPITGQTVTFTCGCHLECLPGTN